MAGNTESSVRYTGGCLCGAVRYEATAEPMVTGHCQCRTCQQLSGAGHASHIAFPADALNITGTLTDYKTTADSGATVTSSFCPTCGSPVFGGTTSMPQMRTVRAASLDDPSVFAPQMVVFAAKAQPWDRVDGTLPSFPGMPPM